VAALIQLRTGETTLNAEHAEIAEFRMRFDESLVFLQGFVIQWIVLALHF